MADQKKIITFLVLFLFCITFTSARVFVSYPSPSIISLNEDSSTQVIEFENMNLSNNPIVSVSLSGEISGKAYLSSTTLNVPSRNSITITMNDDLNPGTYSGYVNWNDFDSSGQVPTTIIVEEVEEPSYSEIIIFPTSKIITVQQGKEKSQNILITVPSNYPSPITINAVNFNPGTEPITFGDLNLGLVAPGQSIQIPIVFSGVDAQTGTYNTDLSILATDAQGQISLPSVSLTLQVSTGVTPITEETFSTPPSCSLTAITLNLNQTYSLTCSNVHSNMDVFPDYSYFWRGEHVEVSPGLYKYDFIPLKYGETTFRAIFKAKGSPIFEAYEQPVRISSSGSAVPGTDLSFIFTPSLDQATGEEPIIIQLVDNKTGSLVENPRLFIDAIEITHTNNSAQTFLYTFESNTIYQLRGDADGYDNYVESIELNPSIIDIHISPNSGDGYTTFSINTSIENVTLKRNGIVIGNPYLGSISPGLNTFEASKEGYITRTINFTVEDYIRITTDTSNFKKKEEQKLNFNKEVSYWEVVYKKKIDSTESEVIVNGSGSSVVFTPKKAGVYDVIADGRKITTLETESSKWLSKRFMFIPLYIYLSIVGLIFIIILIKSFKGGGSSSDSGEQEFQTKIPVGNG